jgi:hypothetical protein
MLGGHDISRYTEGLTREAEPLRDRAEIFAPRNRGRAPPFDIQEIVMKLTDLRVRAAILLFTLMASAFNLGRASEKLEVGVGTELTLLIAVAGALTTFGSSWLILVLLRKRGVQPPVEISRED